MNKLRASYTYLSLWSNNQWEQAIKAYFKLDRYISREMAEGSDYHDQWQKHVEATKRLPDVFGGTPLTSPRCEEKMVIPVYDWLDLVIKPDLIDAPIIHEFKTGVAESDEYARSRQGALYAIGLTFLKVPVKYIDIHQYNQYSKKATFSRVVVTKKMLTEGLEWVEKVGREMFDYFVEQDLWGTYGNHAN
jgi:hypothetical protein